MTENGTFDVSRPIIYLFEPSRCDCSLRVSHVDKHHCLWRLDPAEIRAVLLGVVDHCGGALRDHDWTLLDACDETGFVKLLAALGSHPSWIGHYKLSFTAL